MGLCQCGIEGFLAGIYSRSKPHPNHHPPSPSSCTNYALNGILLKDPRGVDPRELKVCSIGVVTCQLPILGLVCSLSGYWTGWPRYLYYLTPNMMPRLLRRHQTGFVLDNGLTLSTLVNWVKAGIKERFQVCVQLSQSV